jgi:eukaryotic-like serine/threonine-protein kinase
MSQVTHNQRLRPFKPVEFGRYTLLTPLAVGGMGEVFLARLDGAYGFDKLCVIKKILPQYAQEASFLARFINEAKILVKLTHGNIAQVLDMDVHESAPYIALEFVDGKDVRRLLSRLRDKGTSLPLELALFITIQLLDALAYAHRKRGDDDSQLNLVHRDVSPQNVLVSYAGEVKVIDFGLAKSTLSSSKTNPSIILGKLMYMSPEQARHQPVDKRTDLYAVGLCLYELVAGNNPLAGIPDGELMAAIAKPSIARLDALLPQCPSAVADIVVQALSVSVEGRFQTAEEFRGKLQLALAEIAPETSSETLARFMGETFSMEYQAERRMLAHARETARLEPAPSEAAGPETSKMKLPEPPSSPKRLFSVARPLVRNTLLPVQANETPSGTKIPNGSKNSPLTTLPGEGNNTVRASKSKKPRATPPSTSQSIPTSEQSRLLPPASPSSTSSLAVWLVIPLLALVAVGSYVAYDIYSDQITTMQLEQERREGAAAAENEAKRTREVKVPGTTIPDDELADLGTDVKELKPKALPKAPSNLAEGEKALRALKGDVEKLVDGGARAQFKILLVKFDSQVSDRKEDAAWIASVRKVHAEVRAKLSAQQ